ncbi:hypothetical protein F503_03331 [Ophiostoma piceae UAMH 11346]|uniref:Uncharacterized protein n=1 Tax=Ophiostoma piceae (strain UAMH 11346) TaxID=1262450 RepID=S3C045_OPHP1|nr:hypothetical protein F503_03331 [Ophiostoma piceae UAMH 11346]
MDAQAGEAIWRLLTGAAQDSWEAICKHSHIHSATPELRPRRGGAVAAATQTAGSGPDTTYVNTNGQTTTRRAAATTAGATSAIGATAVTGSPSATSSATSSSSGSSSTGTTATSNTGLIAGVVVGAIVILVLAFLIYWFRNSKYIRALCCCCGVGGGRKNKNSSSGGGVSDDKDTHARHMADSNARLVGGASANSLLTPISSSAPASALGMGMGRDSKRGYNDVSEKMSFYGSDAKRHGSHVASYDDEKRGIAYTPVATEAHDLQPPPSVATASVPHSPTSPITPTSAVSSTSSTTASSSSTPRPAPRRRSPSYSTFPSATRSHNYSNSITLAQAASLPTPPPSAIQKDRQSSQSSQSAQSVQSAQSAQAHQKKNSVPRVAVEAPNHAMSFPFNDQPQQRTSRHAPSPLALSTSPEGLVPPPRNSTTRQRLPIAGADENDVDDAVSLAPTFNRSSYSESVGGESISSSVLMSPQGSGPLFDRVAIVPSHVPTVVPANVLPVPRRPLTTVSSVSSNPMAQAQNQGHAVPPMPSRGSMPTRASLSGPSSRGLMQMQAARRPSVASSGSGSISLAVSVPTPPRPQYPYSQSPRGSPQAPLRGPATYQQQQYPHPQRLPPTGYVPPHASAVTVHHTGQATSVRVPIARNPNPQRY